MSRGTGEGREPTTEELAVMQAFLEEMTNVVVPQIVATLGARAELADEMRGRWVPRSRLQTEEALHNGWRKRAEQAEREFAALTAEVQRLRGLCADVIHALAQWDESDGSYIPGTFDVRTAAEYAAALTPPAADTEDKGNG